MNHKYLMIGIASLFLVFSNAKADVVSVSSIKNINIDGVFHRQVMVRCKNQKTRPIITKASGSNKWCLKTQPSQCGNSKIHAAKMACDFVDSGAAPVNTESDAKANTKAKEVLELEKERLAIEKEKLELRKQELELMRMEMELKRKSAEPNNN